MQRLSPAGISLLLHESGVIAVTDPAYQRGVECLRNAQFADGSWHVQTRTFPVQPYFESDFPHGVDQFISAAATNWAVLALAPAAPVCRGRACPARPR